LYVVLLPQSLHLLLRVLLPTPEAFLLDVARIALSISNFSGGDSPDSCCILLVFCWFVHEQIFTQYILQRSIVCFMQRVVSGHQTSQTSVHTSSMVSGQHVVPGRGRSCSNWMVTLYAVE